VRLIYNSKKLSEVTTTRFEVAGVLHRHNSLARHTGQGMDCVKSYFNSDTSDGGEGRLIRFIMSKDQQRVDILLLRVIYFIAKENLNITYSFVYLN
jgi:hypothetical protein